MLRLAAYRRWQAKVNRPLSLLRVARAARVHSESPLTTRCTAPAHALVVGVTPAAVAACLTPAVAGVFAVADVANGAGVRSLPLTETSGRNGSTGACVGTAA